MKLSVTVVSKSIIFFTKRKWRLIIHTDYHTAICLPFHLYSIYMYFKCVFEISKKVCVGILYAQNNPGKNVCNPSDRAAFKIMKIDMFNILKKLGLQSTNFAHAGKMVFFAMT